MEKYNMLINGNVAKDLSCDITVVGDIDRVVDKMIDTLDNACGFIYTVGFDFEDVDGNELFLSVINSQRKHKRYDLVINGITFTSIFLPKETLNNILYQWIKNAFTRHNEVNNIELLDDSDFFNDEIEEIEEY